MAESKPKTKILAWGDYCCGTGFAQVLGNIMRELEATGNYEIDVVGINYAGDPYNREKWPGNVWPALSGINMVGAYADVYGRQRVLDLLGTGEYDVAFFLQDTFILGEGREGSRFIDKVIETQDALGRMAADGLDVKQFKTVYYYPIDATPMAFWIKDVVAKLDYPVAYTEYAKRESLKHCPELEDRLAVIYHGTNPKDFHYIEDREDVANFRHEYFQGKADDKFLIVNVNRNQPRKDTVRNLMVLRELRNRGHNDVVMYLHMQSVDSGGNIIEMGKQLGLAGDDFLMPGPQIFNANQGMPLEAVNMLYNAADVVFTPTLGEGWGLSITEAMATKTPIIAPNHTSISEILDDGRGVLVDAGRTPSDWIVKEMDNDRLRPLMDVDMAADAIIGVKEGKKAYIRDLEAAHKWAHEYSWANICKEWIGIIDQAAAASKTDTAKQTKVQYMSRAARRKAERMAKKKARR